MQREMVIYVMLASRSWAVVSHIIGYVQKWSPSGCWEWALPATSATSCQEGLEVYVDGVGPEFMVGLQGKKGSGNISGDCSS